MGAPKRQRPTFYLLIPQPNGDKQVIVWDTVDITVGRSSSQDIVVADAEVSREHAVFRRHGDACEVQDLNTGLGTSVDGRSIKVHPLQHGNVVRIGTLEITFGQSAQPIARAKNVRFASELKEFGFAALDDAAGRTMLGFDTEDDLQAARSASSSASTPRAVTADGRVELDAVGAGALDLGASSLDLGAEGVKVRDLDLDLAAEMPAPGESAPARESRATEERGSAADFRAPDEGAGAAERFATNESASAAESANTAPTEPKLAPRTSGADPRRRAAARLEPLAIDAIQTAPGSGAKTLTTVKLVLEVRGPADQVEALVDAIRDRRIAIAPLELLVRDI